MPQFIRVATTDELADEQAQLVEVEGQTIALFRVDGGFKCAGSGGARMRPSQLDALRAA
jgi:nitrite reductase/ring-hydroxylating ferredoxin subunit